MLYNVDVDLNVDVPWYIRILDFEIVNSVDVVNLVLITETEVFPISMIRGSRQCLMLWIMDTVML